MCMDYDYLETQVPHVYLVSHEYWIPVGFPISLHVQHTHAHLFELC